MAIDFNINGNNRGFKRAADDTVNSMRQMAKEAGNTQTQVNGMFKDMAKQAAAFAGLSLGAAGMKAFASSVVNVRKEMQSLSTSFKVLLGDEAKASAMFGELKEFAATTPLMLKDLASGAQTMLGFNIEAEKVVPTLKAIGDISMGDSQKFQSLTLAFSQMSATGKLMGQDLLQMINAGFNPLTEIARKTGKSIGDLKEEMSQGAISAEMVADAFMSATSEGGKFYGMLEKQGADLKGQINQLQGALDDMFNSIGEKSQGAISSAIGGVTTLVQNYEKVGKILATLIASYGMYKAATVGVAAIEMTNAVGIGMTTKAMWEEVLATKAGTAAQYAFNAAVSANPYVLLATALVTVVGLFWSFADGSDAAAEAQKRLNGEVDRFTAKQEDETKAVKELIAAIKDESATDAQRKQAYDELKVKCAALTDQYSMEQIAVMDLTKAYKALNEVQEADRMKFIAEDTNKLVRVYNDLIKVKSGKQKVASSSTQQFIKDNNLAGMGFDDILKMLKQRITDQRNAYNKWEEAKNNTTPSTTYQEDAKKAMNDWKAAKSYYDKMVKSETATAKEVADARAKMEAADKAYETLTGTKASDTTKNGGKSVEKQSEAQQRLLDLEASQARERERRVRDQELAIAAARISGMADGKDKVLKQADLDYEEELEKIERQQQDLLAMREKDARELWEAQNKKDGATWTNSGAQKQFFDNGGGKLTQMDEDYFNALKEAAKKTHEKTVADQNRIDTDAMNEYLAKYGTYQQKRKAISDKYTELIKKAENEGSALSLKKEMEEALSDVDMEQFKKSMNWEAIFGDLNKYTKSQLEDMSDMLVQFKEGKEYANATVENKKVIDNALQEISDTIASKGGIFGNLGEALDQLAKAEKELIQAENELKNAKTSTEKEAAKEKVQTAKIKKTNSEAKVNDASVKAAGRVTELADTLGDLSKSSDVSIKAVGEAGLAIAKNFGAELGPKLGGWLGAAFAVLDAVGQQGILKFTENLSKSIIGSVAGLFGITGLFESDTKIYYENQKKVHDNYIKILRDIISDQEELMKKQTGLDALKTYEEADDYYTQIIYTRLKDIENFLNSGASEGLWGIGSSASEGVKIFNDLFAKTFYESMTGVIDTGKQKVRDEYLRIFGIDEITDKRLPELATATVEQIKQLQKVQEIWNHLPDEVIAFYNEILEADKAANKLKDTFDEISTTISFESVEDEFTSTLENMDAKAQDWADDVEGYFNKAVINGLVKAKYSQKLKDWYGDAAAGTGFAGAMQQGIKTLTKTQIDELRQGYMDIVDEAKTEADNIREMLNIQEPSSSSASNSVGVSNEVTGEQVNEICGRLTALQIQGETAIVQRNQVIGLCTEANSIVSDILELDAVRNTYLVDIYERLGIMQAQINNSLLEISTNTKNL